MGAVLLCGIPVVSVSKIKYMSYSGCSVKLTHADQEANLPILGKNSPVQEFLSNYHFVSS